MKISENRISLLYVDDEPLLLDLTKEYLESGGDVIVDTSLSAKEGLELIRKKDYDAVISDYQMPDKDGLEFLKILRREGNNIPFIIFTGRGREEVAIEALNAGADYYLQKGGKLKVQFGELSNFIRKAVDKSRAEKAVLEHEQRMTDVINFLPDVQPLL
ncbi:MAG: response regulator [Methanomicrobiaceae archaeon]|nr:response regulator [Methanomicrobiaceae archaeon]